MCTREFRYQVLSLTSKSLSPSYHPHEALRFVFHKCIKQFFHNNTLFCFVGLHGGLSKSQRPLVHLPPPGFLSFNCLIFFRSLSEVSNLIYFRSFVCGWYHLYHFIIMALYARGRCLTAVAGTTFPSLLLYPILIILSTGFSPMFA